MPESRDGSLKKQLRSSILVPNAHELVENLEAEQKLQRLVKQVARQMRLMGQGNFMNQVAATAAQFWSSATSGTIGVDTTANNVIRLTATWATADPANTITCTNPVIELLG